MISHTHECKSSEGHYSQTLPSLKWPIPGEKRLHLYDKCREDAVISWDCTTLSRCMEPISSWRNTCHKYIRIVTLNGKHYTDRDRPLLAILHIKIILQDVQQAAETSRNAEKELFLPDPSICRPAGIRTSVTSLL